VAGGRLLSRRGRDPFRRDLASHRGVLAIGAFCFAVAWFQAVSAIAIVARPNRRLLLLAVAVNLVVVGIWVWSRTTGLPIGPEAGEREAIGEADVLSSVLEAVLVAWAVGMLVRQVASREVSLGLAVRTTAIVWAGVVGTTALVFFTEAGESMPH
jgi:EamA domain-containing membrane protein RarD